MKKITLIKILVLTLGLTSLLIEAPHGLSTVAKKPPIDGGGGINVAKGIDGGGGKTPRLGDGDIA